MTAKYDSQCAECEGRIEKGDRMVYDVEAHKAYCRECGRQLVGEEKQR
jgi:predicted SprT family Zn-dependent metalloprotease